MSKKLLAFVVILAMVAGGTTAYAETIRTNVPESGEIIIVPFWDYAQDVKPVISFTNSKYSGQIYGNSDVTKISMTVVLSVKNSNGTYSEVSRTSGSSNTNVITKSNSYYYVKGNTYKLTVTGQVYVGSSYETVEKSITATY